MKTDLKKKLFLSEEQSVSVTDETTTGMQDKIIFSLLVSYVVIVTLALITAKFLGHTEESEWLIYEISSIVIFVLVAILGRFKKITNNSYFNQIVKLSPTIGLILFVTQILFLTFFFHVINYGYLALILAGVIASHYFYKKNSENLIRSLLINSVLLFCVEGYFFEYFEYFNRFKILEYLFVLIVWILLSLIIFALSKMKLPRPYGRGFFPMLRREWNPSEAETIRIHSRSYDRDFLRRGIKISKAHNKITSIVVFLLVVFVAFNSTRKIIDHWHYSFVLGPVYELSLGKSLLNDIPSMYGYLSVHFIKLILAPFGINFENFHLFNTALFFLYYLGFYFAYKKIFRDNLFTCLFSLVTTLINMRFYVSEVRGLPPSSGPIRFGIGLLVILALLYLPQKINFWVMSLLAAITIFWSPEVAIYVVPAFLFTFLINAISQGKKPTKILASLITSLIPFAIFTAGIFFLIVLKEYGYHGTFPNFSDYFQFISLYKNYQVRFLVPLFGNYYLAVLIMIVGLCLVFFREWDVQKNKLLTPLSFLAIYNVAIFSYFVPLSIPITLNNISCFILLELAIVFQYFRKNKHFWSRIFLPGTLFMTIFMIICTWNILGIVPREDYEMVLNSQKMALADYQILKKTYDLTSENVLILSKFYDTLIIAANQIKTIWPLNPSACIILIPNYIEKYLAPNLDKIRSGTKIVYTEDFPPEFSDFLNRNYIFDEINPEKRVGIFRVYNFRPRQSQSN